MPNRAFILGILECAGTAAVQGGDERALVDGLPKAASVPVVSESWVNDCAEALGGLSTILPAGSFRLVDAGGRTLDRDLTSALEGNESRVAIAAGSAAWR